MHWTQLLFGALASIALFVHSLEHFSNKLKNRANDRLKNFIHAISGNKFKGLLLGFIATAVIQSSSAAISILVSFVDSGIIAFGNTLPILLGANIGTTVTAWLVSLDIQYLAMVLISIGFILSYFPEKVRFYSKPIFYLGLILFSLELIGTAMEPLKSSQETIEFLKYAANPFVGVLLGMLITAITQSSSVTIGLAIILADQGVLELESAIAILVGSNLGTTTTAFLAALKLNKTAKKTALLNLLINAFGVLLYLPFYQLFDKAISSIDTNIAMQVAYAHLIFNLAIAIILLPFSTWITKKVVNRLMPLEEEHNVT